MQNSKRCIIKHLRRLMTGWSAPAERTSFLMLTEEWTRLPIAPTCQIRTQMLTRIRKTVNVRNAPAAARWTLQSVDSKSATNGGIPPSILQSMHQHGFSNDKHAYKSIYAGSCLTRKSKNVWYLTSFDMCILIGDSMPPSCQTANKLVNLWSRGLCNCLSWCCYNPFVRLCLLPASNMW